MDPEPPNNERRMSWRPARGRRFPGDRRASATPPPASGPQALPEAPEAAGTPETPEIPGTTASPAPTPAPTPDPVPAPGLGGVVVLGLIALLLPSAITWLAFPLHIPLYLLDSPAGPGSANLPAWSPHVLAGVIGALFVGSLLRRVGWPRPWAVTLLLVAAVALAALQSPALGAVAGPPVAGPEWRVSALVHLLPVAALLAWPVLRGQYRATVRSGMVLAAVGLIVAVLATSVISVAMTYRAAPDASAPEPVAVAVVGLDGR
ncbi:hypothetical protein [Nocardiopsis sp. JB363]|uniref:hypothetical protein n=1 Tax=Nocardiopsis sp. JB363 TaxID=1434837 RepID=UPI00117D31CA|nr:hypothetical protein [Nocardiopsis sp. JB363]